MHMKFSTHMENTWEVHKNFLSDPLLSISDTILFRGLLGMISAMLPEKRWGAISVSVICQNDRNENLISTSNLSIIIILMFTPMFPGSKNRMKPLIQILGHTCLTNLEKANMAAGEMK